MGRRYSLSASAVTNTGSKTLLIGVNSTSIRPEVFDLVLSSGGVAPADHAAEYQLKRSTNTGTSGTTIAPVVLDSGDPASLMLSGTTAQSGVGMTGEPGYASGNPVLDFSVNMRATFRWVARERSEIVIAATANFGFGLFVNAVDSAFGACATILEEE
jgi:hypothetical protein